MMDMLDDIIGIEKKLVLKATEDNIPIGGTFELLPLCNMNCNMCYIRLNNDELKSKGRIHSAQEWLDIARQMKNAGTLFILLTGGEPFLYPEFKELYIGLKKMGMIITINTNGTLITEEIAELLGKNKPRRVNVTLYGASNATYEKICNNPFGFDQTIRGINLMKKHKIDIKLNGTLVPENKDEIYDLFELAKRLELYLKVDTYMFPLYKRSRKNYSSSKRLSAKEAGYYYYLTKRLSYTKEEFEDYRKYMIDNVCECKTDDLSLQCRAGKSSFWIQWNGNMTPCVFMNEPSINVFEHGFCDSWEFIKKNTKCLHLSSECGACKYKNICQVCGACTYCETGNFDDKPNYMCEYMNELVTELEKHDENIK